ncbi:Rz1-like lysis system protein LysC [Marinobacter bryozoorum]|uniref:Rz1-like lysis system protein LysC n=1 Tax=Marinobacter bryozoorum TaxID=256324 RepID=UPI003CFC2FBA
MNCAGRWKAIRVLSALILAPWLTACGTTPVIEYRTEYVYPPSPLLQPSPVPEYTGRTWGDLPEYCAVLQSELRQCDADKQAVREWVDGHRTNSNKQ